MNDPRLERRDRPRDHRQAFQETFEQRTRNNAYIAQVYEYPDLLYPAPNPLGFREFWQAQALGERKLHVEIGCGSGRYLMQWAAANPTHFFMGFELRFKRLVMTARKLHKLGRDNVLLIRDKGEYLDDYLGERSLDFLHVNFPDPWPKLSHRKHRLLNPDFLRKLERLLKPGGQILFKTDHAEYFQAVCELLQDFPHYILREQTSDLHHSPYQANNIETEFEQLFKSKGNPPIGYLRCELMV